VSEAEQFTVVVPRTKVLPEAGEHVTGRDPSTISVAEAEKVTTAPDGPVASSVISLGSVSAGGVVSTTVTVKLPDKKLKLESNVQQETVVVPIGNVFPESRLQSK
jgi:hypothetical protein